MNGIGGLTRVHALVCGSKKMSNIFCGMLRVPLEHMQTYRAGLAYPCDGDILQGIFAGMFLSHC